MIGAKVNGKIVTFDYVIKNGDRIEILTAQNAKGPSRDWLNIVKSTQARTKINQWFRKQYKDEDIVKGKELLEIAAKQRGYNLSYLTDHAVVETIYRRYGMKSWDAICASIGYGSMKERQVIQKLIDETLKVKKELPSPQQIVTTNTAEGEVLQRNKRHSSGIIVKGVGDIAVRFSKCCGPLPGDEIIGYITRGRGVSIHRKDCVNIINMPQDEKERLIEASWLEEKQTAETKRTYVTEIQITCLDRMGIIVDVSKILTDMKLPVKSFNAKTTKSNAVFNVKIEISDIYQLEELTRKILQVRDVLEIIRVSS